MERAATVEVVVEAEVAVEVEVEVVEMEMDQGRHEGGWCSAVVARARCHVIWRFASRYAPQHGRTTTPQLLM